MAVTIRLLGPPRVEPDGVALHRLLAPEGVVA